MKAALVRFLKQSLASEGYAMSPDARLDMGTYQAVESAIVRRAAMLPDGWQGWSRRRKAVAYLQCLCRDQAIEVGDIDGLWGPQTEYATGVLLYTAEHGEAPVAWRDIEPADLNPNNWPSRDEASLIDYYGETGANQVRLALPYPHRLAWQKTTIVNAMSCNARVRDSLARVLQAVLDHYGIDRIRELRLDIWGGCLNVRRERGGTKWSTHSWGIALDYDPDNNKLQWGRDRAAFARPEYDAWWACWENEGWVSLGRTKNYDWMHVQAAKL